MKKYLPILSWLPAYKKAYLNHDIVAGLTVGVMLIPQGMAYAMIAGLPPVYGLYAAMIPQIVYAFFGTSRQLGVGPVAMDSLLVAAAVSVLAEAGSDQYIALALLLAFMMGSVQLILGITRMGFLVNFLSKPVISGFTSAAALIIGLNQLNHLLGLNLGRNNNIFITLYEALQSWSQINLIDLTIGIAGIVILLGVKKIHKAIPAALVAVVLSIVAVQLLNLDSHGVGIIGVVPQGLPKFIVPDLNSDSFGKLIPAALTLALIAFMEAVSVAKAIQVNHKDEYEIDANQELIGLGLGNVIGSFFGSFPTTGGFSRSAVNEQVGAKTNLAAIISALLIGLTLLYLTPLFYYLPNAILAAIIMVAVFGLINIRYPLFLLSTRKEDLLMLLIAFSVTLGLGIKQGIGFSVVISLLAMIFRTTKPHYAVLGRFKDQNVYRNIKRYDNLIVREDLLIIRYDADLYFANISHFVDSVKQEVKGKGSKLKAVILQGNTITHIDTTAYLEITELIKYLENVGIYFFFTDLIGPTRDFLQRAGIDEFGMPEKSFHDIETAIDHFDKLPKEPGTFSS